MERNRTEWLRSLGYELMDLEKNEKILFVGFDDSQNYCRIVTEKDFYKIFEFWNYPLAHQISEKL